MLFRTLGLLGLALLSNVAQAQVNALPPTRHILVYGDAQARAVPDRYKIAMQFDAVDADPAAARERVETQVQDVIGKLKAVGVAEHEIVATSLQIDARQRYDSESREQVFLGTGVRRTLTARFGQKQALERFLATVRTSKELSISGVTAELASEAELRRQLRQKSIESSREKAEVIARAYGAKLGGVYSVSDVAPQFQYGVQEGSWPTAYDWNTYGYAAGSGNLERVVVSGSRLRAGAAPSFQAGYIDFQDKIYTVFLLAD
ncbi:MULTISPECIES: SIMPL domain-containing protein [unclassified Lysobacter]|uniref:SIMPL domain-containing protein n=1 Tax=unclassified Lysobacter TaxID=2635362 RepID=UPI0006FE6F77|nr:MULTISPECIES: SIMPL domain-containing protein [unclassified Lysobacter]KQZ56404.1 hypothetical protein ASD53_12705 [Lysobacter sp. Root559]KRC35160.1 hypothetical protein ASE10_10875 [Lysobacter sp. Root76]KRD70848.1 hypothetical protein ASE45_03040 [Lysobacter sp. Root96]